MQPKNNELKFNTRSDWVNREGARTKLDKLAGRGKCKHVRKLNGIAIEISRHSYCGHMCESKLRNHLDPSHLDCHVAREYNGLEGVDEKLIKDCSWYDK